MSVYRIYCETEGKQVKGTGTPTETCPTDALHAVRAGSLCVVHDDEVVVIKNPEDGTDALKIHKSGKVRFPNILAGATPANVVNKLEVFDLQGNSKGFIAVYDSVT